MSIQIIIDSTTHVSRAIEQRFRVVPLTVHFGAQEYLDGVTISGERFYEMLIETDTLPTTSQPTPDAYIRAYEAALREADQVIVLDHGRIIGCGKHDELMEKCTEYKEISDSQMGGAFID